MILKSITKHGLLLLGWSVVLIFKNNLENGDMKMEFLQKLADQIAAFGTGPAMAVIGMMIEMGLRLLKTEKPLSILLLVSGFLKGVANVFTAASSIIDKVVPQRIK